MKDRIKYYLLDYFDGKKSELIGICGKDRINDLTQSEARRVFHYASTNDLEILDKEKI